MTFLLKSITSAITPTGDFSFCPSCGQNFGIFAKVKCEYCKRVFCNDCIKRANNNKSGTCCGGCVRLRSSGILSTTKKAQKTRTIIQIVQPLTTDEVTVRKYAFKDFNKEYQNHPELYTAEFIAEAGLVPYLLNCFQDNESRLFVSRMMKETIIYNINLGKVYTENTLKMICDVINKYEVYDEMNMSHNQMNGFLTSMSASAQQKPLQKSLKKQSKKSEDKDEVFHNVIFFFCEMFLSWLKYLPIKSHKTIEEMREDFDNLKSNHEGHYYEMWSEKQNRDATYVTMLEREFVREECILAMCNLYKVANEDEKTVMCVIFNLFLRVYKDQLKNPSEISLKTIDFVFHCLDEINGCVVLPLLNVLTQENDRFYHLLEMKLLEKMNMILQKDQSEEFAKVCSEIIERIDVEDNLEVLKNNMKLFTNILKFEEKKDREESNIILSTIDQMLMIDEAGVGELLLIYHIDIIEVLLSTIGILKREKGLEFLQKLIVRFNIEAYEIIQGRELLNKILDICRLNNCNPKYPYLTLIHIYDKCYSNDQFVQYLIENEFVCFMCEQIGNNNKEVVQYISMLLAQITNDQAVVQDIFDSHSSNYKPIMNIFHDDYKNFADVYDTLTHFTDNKRIGLTLLKTILKRNGLIDKIFSLDVKRQTYQHIFQFLANIFKLGYNDTTFQEAFKKFLNRIYDVFKELPTDAIPSFLDMCIAICKHSEDFKKMFTQKKTVERELLIKSLFALIKHKNDVVKRSCVKFSLLFIDEIKTYMQIKTLEPDFLLKIKEDLRNDYDQPYLSMILRFIRSCLIFNQDSHIFNSLMANQQVLNSWNPKNYPVLNDDLFIASLSLFVTLCKYRVERKYQMVDCTNSIPRLFELIETLPKRELTDETLCDLMKTMLFLKAPLHKAKNISTILPIIISMTGLVSYNEELVKLSNEFLIQLMQDKDIFVQQFTLELFKLFIEKRPELGKELYQVLSFVHTNNKRLKQHVQTLVSNEEIEHDIFVSRQHVREMLALLRLFEFNEQNDPIQFIMKGIEKIEEFDLFDKENFVLLLLKIPTHILDSISPHIEFDKLMASIIKTNNKELIELFFNLIDKSSNAIQFIKSLVLSYDYLIDYVMQTGTHFDILNPFLIFTECRMKLSMNQMYMTIIFDGLLTNPSCGMVINHLLIDDTFFTLLLLSVDFRNYIKTSFENKNIELQQTLLTLMITASQRDGKYLTIDFIEEFTPLIKSQSPLFTLYLEFISKHISHKNISTILSKKTFVSIFTRIIKEKNDRIERNIEYLSLICSQTKCIEYLSVSEMKEIIELITKKRTENLSQKSISYLFKIINSFMTLSNQNTNEMIPLILKNEKHILVSLKSNYPNTIQATIEMLMKCNKQFEIEKEYITNVVQVSKEQRSNDVLRMCVVDLLLMIMKSNNKQFVKEVQESIGLDHLMSVNTKDKFKELMKLL